MSLYACLYTHVSIHMSICTCLYLERFSPENLIWVFFCQKGKGKFTFCHKSKAKKERFAKNKRLPFSLPPLVFRKRRNRKSTNAQPQSEPETQNEALVADCVISGDRRLFSETSLFGKKKLLSGENRPYISIHMSPYTFLYTHVHTHICIRISMAHVVGDCLVKVPSPNG